MKSVLKLLAVFFLFLLPFSARAEIFECSVVRDDGNIGNPSNIKKVFIETQPSEEKSIWLVADKDTTQQELMFRWASKGFIEFKQESESAEPTRQRMNVVWIKQGDNSQQPWYGMITGGYTPMTGTITLHSWKKEKSVIIYIAGDEYPYKGNCS